MRWFVVNSVYDAVRPVTHLSKLFGLWSSGWSPGPSQWKCWHSFLYVALFLALNCYSAYVTFYLQRFDYMYQSLIIGNSEIIYVFLLFFVIMYSILWSWFSQDKLAIMLKMLHQVDIELFSKKMPIDHQEIHLKLVAALVGSIVSTLVLTIVAYFFYEQCLPGFKFTAETFLSFLLTLYCYILNWVLATTMVFLASTRFRKLNIFFR